MSKKLVRGLAVGGAVFLVALLVHSLGVFEPLEWKSWDLRLRLFASASRADRDIALILIDQESLDVYEKAQSLPWPWPRQIYVALVDYLKAGGAKAVFFDLILSEGSRYGVEDDEMLARAMAAAGDVFIPFFLSDEPKDKDEGAVRELGRFALPRESVPARAVEPLRSVSLPIEVLLRAAAGSGNVRFAPDEDGIFRRIPLAFGYEGLVLPSLPLAMKEFVGGGAATKDVPLDRRGRMIIRYHGPAGTYRTYSAAAIINSWAQMDEGKAPQIDPKEFAGKTVLVGDERPRAPRPAADALQRRLLGDRDPGRGPGQPPEPRLRPRPPRRRRAPLYLRAVPARPSRHLVRERDLEDRRPVRALRRPPGRGLRARLRRGDLAAVRRPGLRRRSSASSAPRSSTTASKGASAASSRASSATT